MPITGAGSRTNIIKILIEYATKGVAKANAAAQKTNKEINKQTSSIVKQNARIAQAPSAHKKALSGFAARGKAVDKVVKSNAENIRMNGIAQQGF